MSQNHIDNIQELQEQPFFRNKAEALFGKDWQQKTELVTRYAEREGSDHNFGDDPSSYVIKLKNETGGKTGRDLKRLIILPPAGYTANQVGLMNSHDEVQEASITVLGAVRPGKSQFSTLKNCIAFVHAPLNDCDPTLGVPYKTVKDPEVKRETLDSGQKRKVADAKNGHGFYHNLVNLTDDYIVLELDKELRLTMKPVNLEPFMKDTDQKFAEMIKGYFQQVQKYGDMIFDKAPEAVNEIVNYSDKAKIIPPLIEMLKVHDAGKHEACTVFATLLKIAKSDPKEFLTQVKESQGSTSEPSFYLEQLVRIVDKKQPVTKKMERPEDIKILPVKRKFDLRNFSKIKVVAMASIIVAGMGIYEFFQKPFAPNSAKQENTWSKKEDDDFLNKLTDFDYMKSHYKGVKVNGADISMDEFVSQHAAILQNIDKNKMVLVELPKKEMILLNDPNNPRPDLSVGNNVSFER